MLFKKDNKKRLDQIETTDYNRKLLKISELSDILKVSIHTIYYWVNKKEIPYYKIGRHLRFSLEDARKNHNLEDPFA